MSDQPQVRPSALRGCIGVTIRELTERYQLPSDDAHMIYLLAEPVLSNAKFLSLPASRTGKHHYYGGGLQEHTKEVTEAAVAQLRALPGVGRKVDWVALIVGAVWHDYGKVREYNFRSGFDGLHHPRGTRYKPGDIVYAHEKIGGHHISLCLCDFGRIAACYNGGVESPRLRHIVHIIEAHHGRREWGSPHTPRTIEALAVHQADMLSVMSDCGTNPAERP